jgi:DNA segregation ATPase FtsK/SpoIIIE, S-DNA-T family
MARRGRKRSPFRIRLRVETLYSLGSLFCFAAAGLMMISFMGQGQSLQAINDVMRQSFGVASFFLPFLFITAGLVLTGAKWSFAKPQVVLGSFLFFLSIMVIAQAGDMGLALFTNFSELIQPIGTRLVFGLVGVAGFFILTDTSLRELFRFFFGLFEIDHSERGAADKKIKTNEAPVINKNQGTVAEAETNKGGFSVRGIFNKGDKDKNKKEKTDVPTEGADKPKLVGNREDDFIIPQHKLGTSDTNAATLQNDPKTAVWEYPPLSLLSDKRGKAADRGDINQNAQIIEDTLESFGIKTQVKEVNCGPAVTQYAIQISSGTKLTKVTGLANDLALALAAPTGQIRIEAPIPGRSLVGIEVPNRSLEVVTLHYMLTAPAMQKQKSKLAVALGLNVAGERIIGDIASMPHALIAGATGSGKSVAINAFIASILFRASPQEVKFIMVDPKRVELTQYNDIPHLLTPVITDTKKVVSALKWACKEMEERYKVFQEVGVRNIAGYNQVAGFQAMPYIVIVVDELADIMLLAPNDVETAITRLAQMARAVGIHLLIATQRPSVDVITGLIKANIPTRIAFNVSSGTDSRVILDTPGAEKLLGKGDMLFIPPDEAKPQRIQGTFVSDQEITNLIKFIRQQGAQPEYKDDITTKFPMSERGSSAGDTSGEQDEMFIESVRVVIESQKASTSFLQRRLRLGYTRAARILDQMQEAGIVSAGDGAKPREVNREAAEAYIVQHGQHIS